MEDGQEVSSIQELTTTTSASSATSAAAIKITVATAIQNQQIKKKIIVRNKIK